MNNLSYRAEFIKKHPGKHHVRGGYWYTCASCGKQCGRPGRENVPIPQNIKMEVDHIKPWIKGGSDKVWNLQPMCHVCNRSKSDSVSFKDRLKILWNDIVHFDFIPSAIRRAARNNKVLKKSGITARNGEINKGYIAELILKIAVLIVVVYIILGLFGVFDLGWIKELATKAIDWLMQHKDELKV